MCKVGYTRLCETCKCILPYPLKFTRAMFHRCTPSVTLISLPSGRHFLAVALACICRRNGCREKQRFEI